MQITVFSIMMSLIWVSAIAGIIRILRRQMSFLRVFSIYPLIILVTIGLIRLAIPIEFSYGHIIRSRLILPGIQGVLCYPLLYIRRGENAICLAYLLVFVWIAVSIVKLCKRISEYRRVYGILNSIPSVDDEYVRGILNKVQEICGMKRQTKIIYDKGIKTPAVIGFSSPIIILPKIDFSEDELFGILIHEWTHYCRGHAIVKGIGILAQTMFWWNPFCKYFNNEIAGMLEMCSDKAVASNLDEKQRRSYLDAIVKVLRNQIQGDDRTEYACCLVERTTESHLELRFKMLLEDNYLRDRKKMHRLFTVVSCVLMIFSYLFVLQPYSEPDADDYRGGIVVLDDDYFIKVESGYNLYSREGEYKFTVPQIDEGLKHLLIDEEDMQ